MRAVPAGALAQVYAEFVERSQQAVAVPRGGVRYLRRIATRALGEARAREIFAETQQSPLDAAGERRSRRCLACSSTSTLSSWRRS